MAGLIIPGVHSYKKCAKCVTNYIKDAQCCIYNTSTWERQRGDFLYSPCCIYVMHVANHSIHALLIWLYRCGHYVRNHHNRFYHPHYTDFWDNYPGPAGTNSCVSDKMMNNMKFPNGQGLNCFEGIIAGFPCATPSCSLGDATDGCVLCRLVRPLPWSCSHAELLVMTSSTCTKECIKCHQDSYKSTTSVRH